MVPKKKKRKRIVTAARVATKAKKRAQSKVPEPSTAAARFERYKEEQPGVISWPISVIYNARLSQSTLWRTSLDATDTQI